MEYYLIPKRLATAFAGFLLMLAFVNMTGVVSADMMAGAIPVFCPFEALTGIPCPGCGMTRAMLRLVAGDPAGAAAYNPFCFFLVFMVIASVLPVRYLDKVPAAVRRLLPLFYAAFLAAVMIFWLFDRLLPVLML